MRVTTSRDTNLGMEVASMFSVALTFNIPSDLHFLSVASDPDPQNSV